MVRPEIDIERLIENATPAQQKAIAEKSLQPTARPTAWVEADGVVKLGDPLNVFTISGIYSYQLIPIVAPERSEMEILRELIEHGEVVGGNFAKLAQFAKRLLPPTRQGEK